MPPFRHSAPRGIINLMRVARAVGLSALILGLSIGCNGGSEVESEGLLSFGFEASSFLPCGSQEGWWVIPTPELTQQYAALNVLPGQSAFASLRGQRSDRGHYGHLDSYRYEFEVTEVVALRQAQPTDCQLIPLQAPQTSAE